MSRVIMFSVENLMCIRIMTRDGLLTLFFLILLIISTFHFLTLLLFTYCLFMTKEGCCRVVSMEGGLINLKATNLKGFFILIIN